MAQEEAEAGEIRGRPERERPRPARSGLEKPPAREEAASPADRD